MDSEFSMLKNPGENCEKLQLYPWIPGHFGAQKVWRKLGWVNGVMAADSSMANDLAALHDLADLWDSDPSIRARGRSAGLICMWPAPKLTGVASSAACALNSMVLTHTAKWWVSQQEDPAAIPIEKLRNQVSFHGKEPQIPELFEIASSKYVSLLWETFLSIWGACPYPS